MTEDPFDSILEDVDEFGIYQRLLLAFVLLPGFVPVGFHAYNQLFMAATPDHYCKVPFLEALNYTEETIKNITIPLERRDGRLVFSQCEMYDVDEVTVMALLMNASDTLIKIYDDDDSSGNMNKMGGGGGGESENESGQSSTTTGKTTTILRYPKIPCKYGWNYDLTTYKSTIVTEWNTVCDKGFLPTFALVMLGLSGIVGNYVFGNLQDSLGRRPSFFIYLTIQCFFGIGTGFAKDFWTWLIMRIGVGFTVPALMNTPFVLACELVGPSRRTLCTLLLNIAYSLILMTLAVVAYIFRDWRDLAFATTLPFLLFFSYWWILPESPRWLFAHGKLDKTERILRQMAHVNGRSLPPDYNKILQIKFAEKVASDKLQENKGEDISSTENQPVSRGPRHKYGVLDLLRGKVLRRNTIIITFIWFTTMGVYVGLSYYAPALGGDEYLNFFLAGLAELPTYFFLFPLLDNWGRRWTLFSSLVLGGVACVCTILIAQHSWITLTLYCVGKFGISAGFVAIQQMALEIYPTVVRGLGISFSNVIGMIGPALVPLVNYTGQEYLYLPLLTLGALMVLGGIAGLGLPETLGRSLPQTLLDAEQFTVDCSNQSCCPNRKRKNTCPKKSCDDDDDDNDVEQIGMDTCSKKLPNKRRRQVGGGDGGNNGGDGDDLETSRAFLQVPSSSSSSEVKNCHSHKRAEKKETVQVFLLQEQVHQQQKNHPAK